MQTLLFVIDNMSEMECSSMVGSDSTCSFDESANVINDCYNNMVCDDTNDVSGLEETEVVAPEFEEMEEMSINSGDLADYAQGAAQSEASSAPFSRIENVHFKDSEHLARIKAAGRAVEVFKEEGNLVEEIPDSDESLASSEFFTPLQLARIEAINARFEAINVAREPVEFFKEEETLEVKGLGSDVVLTQYYPKSEASSEIFTPLQLARIKAINDAYRARNEEKEMEAVQAMLLADMSITQCSGYGAINANHLITRVIEGLLPKIHSNQLIRNWLLNEKNSFETIFY